MIPEALKSRMLEQLHQGHPGIIRMKALARSFVWRPGVDQQLEQKVKSCTNCQQHQNSPTTASLHPWEWPKRPWVRLHIDYARPIQGKIFLVSVDAYSKWIDIRKSTQLLPRIQSTTYRLFSQHMVFQRS